MRRVPFKQAHLWSDVVIQYAQTVLWQRREWLVPQVALWHGWVGENQRRVSRSLSLSYPLSHYYYYYYHHHHRHIVRPWRASLECQVGVAPGFVQIRRLFSIRSELCHFNRYFESQAQRQPTNEDKSLFRYLLHTKPIYFWAVLKMCCSITSQFSRSQLEYV